MNRNRLQYMVRATHPARPAFCEVISATPDGGPAGGFYVSHPGLGCGKTYDTAESAIRNILADHAYAVHSLLPVQSAPIMAHGAPRAAALKWQVDSHGVYRAVAGTRTVWVFRRAPGDWAYGTAEFGALDNGAEVSAEIVKGGRDIACTAGAARVYDAKRYAEELAAALPAKAKPLRVMHGGELRRVWLVGPDGAVQFAAPAPTAPEIVASFRAAYPEIAAAGAEIVASVPEAASVPEIAAKPAPVADMYDGMPNAADSMWNDALPADLCESVNFELAKRNGGPMTDSEINRIHAPWKAGETAPGALAEIVAADRREYSLATDSAAEAGAEYLESPHDDGPDYTESDLCEWFAKVDSALAILDCPPTTRGEREACPEAGLTDATAEDFALYLATEYRRPISGAEG